MLEIKGLTFRYTDVDVLKSIGLTVPRGSFTAIIGPNGSGKTTLLKTVAKLLVPREGEVQISGKSVQAYSAKALARNVAMVHQNTDAAFDFNIEEVVLMGRYPYLSRFQGESESDLALAEAAMRFTGTTHLREKTLQSVSGGERQRVMIAKALTQATELLLLDEPISHLDIKYQMEIMRLCKRLNREEGLTIVTTLHDINLAARFADYMVMMSDGEIRYQGAPEDVMTREAIRHIYDIDVEIINWTHPLVIPV